MIHSDWPKSPHLSNTFAGSPQCTSQAPPPGKSLLIDPMARVRSVQPRTALQSTIAKIGTRKATETSTKLFVSSPYISKLTSFKMDSLQLPPGLPSPADSDLASPILALVFLLSALLVFLYVILVWLLIMRALVGRWRGEKEEKDMEAQRMFVWALQPNQWHKNNQEDQFEIISWVTLHMKICNTHSSGPFTSAAAYELTIHFKFNKVRYDVFLRWLVQMGHIYICLSWSYLQIYDG